jgi:hypothetical protein
MPKAPHAYVHFENKSEEERYMRIVSMIQKIGLEDHDTFVKHLLATHRNEQIRERNSTDEAKDRITPSIGRESPTRSIDEVE